MDNEDWVYLRGIWGKWTRGLHAYETPSRDVYTPGCVTQEFNAPASPDHTLATHKTKRIDLCYNPSLLVYCNWKGKIWSRISFSGDPSCDLHYFKPTAQDKGWHIVFIEWRKLEWVLILWCGNENKDEREIFLFIYLCIYIPFFQKDWGNLQ